MRRVLIVSPHFPPVSAADMHRVRMSLPYLAENRWEASVLCVDPKLVESVCDSNHGCLVPSEVSVHRAGAISPKWARRLGFGSIDIRSFFHFYCAGSRLIRTHKPDLVFFSTTAFVLLLLGPLWKRRFNVPYAIDFQDPWLDDYYKRTGITPPGGRVRYALAHRVAAISEPKVMRSVSHVISVSPSYVETFRKRYPALKADQFTVLPFAAAEADFDSLPRLQVRQSVFDTCDGKQHWVYVGVVGRIMEKALRLLFDGMSRLRMEHPRPWSDVRFHFVGTDYAPPGFGKKSVEPIAAEYGVSDLVVETTDRLPYFEALQLMKEASALLIIGSDDPRYTASKIYPYILAGKPMISLLHEDSPAVQILRKSRAGEVVTFNPEALEPSAEETADALEQVRNAVVNGRKPEIDWRYFSQYTAREMTKRLCAAFDQAILRN